MKKILGSIKKFLKNYLVLSFVLLIILVAIILYLFSQHKIANLLLGIGALVTAVPLIWDMITQVRGGEYGIDVLAATAIISSVILHQDLAAIIIALMLTGGEALENYAENRAKSELNTLLSNKPKIAHLIKGNDTTEIRVSEVRVGDKLSILPGEVVPVDCKIIDGESSFDESSITGEGLPLYKTVDDQVLSGSVNVEGVVRVQAIHTAADSQYEQIIKLVESAASSHSPFVRLADRYSVPFTIFAFVLGGIVWYVSGHAIRFLEVIVVATPCPLLLAAPIALISGMSRSAKYGIIVKNGSALEKLAQLRTIAFDKTGTLTKGKPTVDQVSALEPFSESVVLSATASLEQNSNHILAKALVTYAKSKGVKTKPAKQIKELVGLGLSGRVQGREIIVGRWNLMLDNKVNIPKGFNSKKISTTATYVAIDKQLAGVITFIDEVRSDSKSLISRLKKLGIDNFLMVTGDNETTAVKIARQLGINDVRAECLPADKMLIIERLEDRPVAFVGDGVNDAPVLTMSDVGIALGASSSTAASESADVVIMLDEVSRVATAIEVAKRTFSIAKQSILVGIFISVILMLVFATGHFKPVYGAVLQEVVDVVVIFNALRAHSIWQNRLKRAKN